MGGDDEKHRILNVNVGILGHIDSGKTSLGARVCRSLKVPRDHRPPPLRQSASTTPTTPEHTTKTTRRRLTTTRYTPPLCPFTHPPLTYTHRTPSRHPTHVVTARALSTHFSTASLDKHPQSTARGITLDLGFSSFMAALPDNLAHLPYDKLQFTLVDCPGHASLIKTVLGGAQIIDIMMLARLLAFLSLTQQPLDKEVCYPIERHHLSTRIALALALAPAPLHSTLVPPCHLEFLHSQRQDVANYEAS